MRNEKQRDWEMTRHGDTIDRRKFFKIACLRLNHAENLTF